MGIKAIKILEETISYAWLRDGMRHYGPGKVVEKLSSEKREILKTLTSDDLADMRMDVMCQPKRKGRWGL